jgi:hypothetical protein
MSAPAGSSDGSVLARLTEQQQQTFIRALARIAWAAAEPTDTAADRRPPEAGVRLTMHEDHVSALQERDVAFEEDSRHVPTSTANRF